MKTSVSAIADKLNRLLVSGRGNIYNLLIWRIFITLIIRVRISRNFAFCK